MNTTLLEHYIKKYNKIAKYMKKQGFKKESVYYSNLAEEFQDCLKVVTGKTKGYLQ